MKIFKHITNGLVIVAIGLLHTKFALSAGVFGKQFAVFSKSYFYKISSGTDDFSSGKPDYEMHAAFWFFYWGMMLIVLGILAHHMERTTKRLPHSFTISYLVFVLMGCYMIPQSGMTYFLLPHALFMIVWNFVRARKVG